MPTEPKVVRITLAPDTTRFTYLGEEGSLTAEGYDAQGVRVPDPELTWSSSDVQVVATDGGTLEAVGPGVAAVTVSAGSATAVAAVVVSQAPSALHVAADSVELDALGATELLAATVDDAGGSAIADAALTWSTADASVAAVDSLGQVWATGPGETRITASIDSLHADVVVTVRQRVHRLVLEPDSVTFDALGDSLTLSGVALDPNGAPVSDVTLTWSVDDPFVVSLTEPVIHARANGTARIQVSVDSLSAETVVIVQQEAVSLDVQPGSLQLAGVGATATLTARARDANGAPVAGAVTWSSAPEGVVQVDAGGRVTALAAGDATVTAQFAGLTATAAVTVSTAPVVPGNLTGLVFARREIHRMTSATSDVAITDSPDYWQTELTASADGSRIAYLKTYRTDRYGTVWVMNRDGSGQREVSSTPRTGIDQSISPDGEWVAFRAQFVGLVVARWDGSDERILMDQTGSSSGAPWDGQAFDISWSPDSEWISFTGGVTGVGTGLLRIRVDGSEAELITDQLRGPNAPSPSKYDWSPDGQRLVFTCKAGALCIVNADGSGHRQLTPDPTPDTANTYPRWSPDGRRISAMADRSTTYWSVVVMDAGTGEDLSLFVGRNDFYRPIWSPDGGYVFYGGFFVSPWHGRTQPLFIRANRDAVWLP